MKRIDIQVTKRDATGKGGARKVRRNGQVPGVIYGEGQDPIVVAVDRHTIEQAIHASGESENMLVNVSVDGEEGEVLALVRETQHDPLTGSLKHLDFRRVSTDKPIKTNVPVVTVGTPKGVREGGIMEQQLREVEIECLPLEIPEAIEIDVSNILIGQSLHVSDIAENSQYTILTAGRRALVMVAAPKVETVVSAAVEEGEEEGTGEGEAAEGEAKAEEGSSEG